MKKSILIFTIIFFTVGKLCSQNLPKRPTFSDVRSYNQSNLLKIDIGFNKTQVIEAMGGVKNIQTYSRSKAKIGVISNPYSRDLKTDMDGNSIEILWYFTDIKNNDGSIRKEDLTPIILEKNSVVGLGWGFYEDYSKRKEFNINLNN